VLANSLARSNQCRIASARKSIGPRHNSEEMHRSSRNAKTQQRLQLSNRAELAYRNTPSNASLSLVASVLEFADASSGSIRLSDADLDVPIQCSCLQSGACAAAASTVSRKLRPSGCLTSRASASPSTSLNDYGQVTWKYENLFPSLVPSERLLYSCHVTRRGPHL
jgi:hypothetical protein